MVHMVDIQLRISVRRWLLLSTLCLTGVNATALAQPRPSLPEREDPRVMVDQGPHPAAGLPHPPPDALGDSWAADHLPPLFREWQLWQVQLWQWLGLGVAFVLALLLAHLGALIMRGFLSRVTRFTTAGWDDALVASIHGPLMGAVWALFFCLLTAFLSLAPSPHGIVVSLCKLAAIVGLGWFLLRVMDVAAIQLQRVFHARGDDLGTAMVPVARKILKPLLFVIALIVALQNVGVDVSGLLAGLGIGGLAFALAAKDTLANLFGSVAIAFDRPFKVGHFVKVGELTGTVEDVGLRSTRIRSLDMTLISIPNAQVADAKIENYTVRQRIRLLTTLGVQYDTTLDQLRFIVDEAKRYLAAHPRVWQDVFRVRFVGYGASSLDIEVFCYVTTGDFHTFTAIREEILIALGEIIRTAGAQLAYPSRTLYAATDRPADSERATRASAVVAERLTAGALCIPEIPETVRQQIAARQRPPVVD